MPRRCVSEKTKRIVAASQLWRCFICRLLLTAFFEVDHVVTLAMGGGNEIGNLQALCPCCHRAKTHADMARLNAQFGKNFFMLFTVDGQDTWFRGVVLEVTPRAYRVLYEDGTQATVPIRTTERSDVWTWV